MQTVHSKHDTRNTKHTDTPFLSHRNEKDNERTKQNCKSHNNDQIDHM